MANQKFHIEQYAGGPDSDWYVFAYDGNGYQRIYLSDATKREALAFQKDMAKLSESTVSLLTGDSKGSGSAVYGF
jgi:hypothetical protein